MSKSSDTYHIIGTAGVSIGVSVVVWMFLVMWAGWYKMPALINVFFAIPIIKVLGIYWGLKKLSTRKLNYLHLIGSGIIMSVIAGVIIFVFSYLFTGFVFPEYLVDVQKMQREWMVSNGVPSEQASVILTAAKEHSSPLIQALSGVVGTTLIGMMSSVIIALFLKPSFKR